jgi:hypothetical protein
MDRAWLSFRDRFGLVWSQRLREQFNRSAANSGWPVMLTWKGLRAVPGASDQARPDDELLMETIRALMKRFMS